MDKMKLEDMVTYALGHCEKALTAVEQRTTKCDELWHKVDTTRRYLISIKKEVLNEHI